MSQLPAVPGESDWIRDLHTLNAILDELNQAIDVRESLPATLDSLVRLMGLETSWLFEKDPESQERWAGRGYRLAAYHDLPPALSLEDDSVWCTGCDCQALCNSGQLSEAVNVVRCSRLADAKGDRRGLAVHASTPLQSGGRVVGILNVAAADWSAFDDRRLALLTNVGNQIGAAMERARLFNLLQEQRVHEQLTLLGLSNQLLSHLDLNELTSWLVEEVRQLMQIDACALLLPDEEDPSFLKFRAASGWFTDPVQHGHRVPLDGRSGSGQVMRTQRPLSVEDAAQHTEHWSTSWLEAEHFRGAAIVPLVANGRSIGTMVIDTRQPRRFEEGELRFLQLMANQAAIALEKVRLHEEEVRRHRMEEELSVGRQIQLSMLPDACPFIPGWQFCIKYEAALQVAGDFYDYFQLADGPEWLGMLVADVSDKGVPAALFMALSRTTIRNSVLQGRAPAEALCWANRFIREDSRSSMFLSAFYGALNTADGRFIYTNAGHNPALWYRAETGETELLSTDGIVLGVLDEVTLGQKEIRLAPGDALVLYTDGLVEAANREYQEFGLARLRALIAEILGRPNCDADLLAEEISAAVHTFTGQRYLSDDLTLFVVRRRSDGQRG